MTYNPKIKNTSNTDMSIDANVDANNITMGEAEDNDWTDGIFAFSTETKVGTAIDKINELLKGLAPKVPSELDNLSTTSAGHDAAIYINNDSGYTAVTEANGAVANVADKSTFSKQTSPNFTQLGAYLYDTNDINIVLDLNGNKEVDAEGSLVNLRENAFLAEVGKTLEFKISINGIDVEFTTALHFLNEEPNQHSQAQTKEITKDSITYGNITLQPTQYGKFFATQADFTQFVHRTGTVTLSVNPNKFRKGFNYVIVSYKHTDETETDWKELNKVSFFLEDKRDRVTTTLSQTLALAQGIETLQTKFLSGIKYYKQANAHYYSSQLESIAHFGEHTYSPASNGGITATDTFGAFQASAHIFDDSVLLADFSYNGTETAAFDFIGAINKRHIGDITSRVTVSDAYGGTRVDGADAIAGTTIFYDSFGTTSTDLVENFDDEAKRINSDGSAFDSTTLENNDLIVYYGILCTQNYSDLADLFSDIINDTFVPEQVGGLPTLNTVTTQWLTYERTLTKSGGFVSGNIKIEGIPNAYKLVKVIDGGNVTYQIRNDSGTEVIKIYFADSTGYKNILRVQEAGGVLQGNPQPPTPASNEVALSGGTLEVQYNLGNNTITAGNSGRIKVEMINNTANEISKITVS